jgi:hypothetical protein
MNALRIGVLGLTVICGGCMTVQMYDGPRRERGEVARISGDLRITAGAPLSVILRQVDGHTLNVGQTSVEVLPGTHKLLADCKIAETDSVTRHAIDVEVFAGRQYQLEAQTGPALRECTNVTLEAVD